MDHDDKTLMENLKALKLCFIRENYQTVAARAAQKEWSHVQ